MDKPAHLQPAEATNRAAWFKARSWSLVCFSFGIVALVVGFLAQHGTWDAPDWRVTVPAFVVTAIPAVLAAARREKGYVFWLVGLGLAAAALVLGWFLMIAIIVGAMLIVMLIMHAVM